MADEKPIARYSFLPWLRQGLASSITQVDDPAGSGGVRAEIAVDVVMNTGSPVSKVVQLHGPGDLSAIDPRAIVRIDPRHAADDYEPNYTPVIEFFDEDFAWRYTPAGAAAHARLRPWICLVVLTVDEFMLGRAPVTHLATITVQDPAVSLPPPQETWAWAHVHVSRDVHGTDGSPAQVLDAVRTILEQDTTQAICRLVCPRKLKPKRTYHAFVIPTFETGRLTGLGLAIPDGTNGFAPAWGAGQDTFPVYYQWEFHTGEDGDFESLVRRLEPHEVDSNVGKRPMDVQTPAPEYNIPAITPPVLELEGALKATNMQGTPWPQREPFLGALTAFLNLPYELTHVGGEEVEDDPLIAPPLYGQFPAAVERVGQPDDPAWFNMLNLDPRHRTAAGFGTRVVQKHQERFMNIAWKQAGMLRQANRHLREAQYARFISTSLYQRHVESLPAHQVLSVTASLHPRVLTSAGLRTAGVTTPVTVQEHVRRSALPVALVSAPFRRIARPRGPLARRIAPDAPRVVGNLIARVERGEVVAVPPKPAPDKGIVLEDVLHASTPPPPGGFLALPLVELLLQVLIFIVRLLSLLNPSLRDMLARLERLRTQVRTADVLNVSKWTRVAVSKIPPAPDFRITEIGGAISLPGVGGRDSTQAAAFRSALKDTHALFEASRQTPPAPPPLRITLVANHVLRELQPSKTIAARVSARLNFGAGANVLPTLDELLIAPDFPEAMYDPLCDISTELLLPNVGLIPNNTISLLKTNQKFIEAYMVGLNHEMAREFIWREYPTDQRSTFFRQFWAAREGPPDPRLTLEARAEKLKDIRHIHLWPHANELGQNNNRRPGPNSEYLVLLIRGDLFRRYPRPDVRAVKAVFQANPPRDEDGCLLYRVPIADDVGQNPADIRTPVFDGEIGSDIRFYGFDLDENTVRGNFDPENPENPAADQGWFFGLRQHPGEPRFGLDDPLKLEEAAKWKELSWANVAGSMEAVAELDYIHLSRPLTFARITGEDPAIQWEASQHSNSATLAYIMLQDPYRMYVHGSDMLPPP
jgi:hypothetical protein